jgi:hypothetical protein
VAVALAPAVSDTVVPGIGANGCCSIAWMAGGTSLAFMADTRCPALTWMRVVRPGRSRSLGSVPGSGSDPIAA